jgi:hypothetical protein
MEEPRILIRLLWVYFTRNWEFGSALSKLQNFGGGGGGFLTQPPPKTPQSTPMALRLFILREDQHSCMPSCVLFLSFLALQFRLKKRECVICYTFLSSHRIVCFLPFVLLTWHTTAFRWKQISTLDSVNTVISHLQQRELLVATARNFFWKEKYLLHS